MDLAYDGGGIGKGGTATLSVDGKEVAKGRVEKTIPVRITIDESFDIGEDSGTPVNLKYDVPFKFTGEIEKVTIERRSLPGVIVASCARPNMTSCLPETPPG